VTRAIWLLALFHPPENLQPCSREKSFSILVDFVHELGVFVAEAQNAIEISYVSGPLQQSGVFELFDVGQVRRLASPNTSKNFRVVT